MSVSRSVFFVPAGKLFVPLLALILLLLPGLAGAVPSFARQTGQNCVACHVGGQFPELTPFGRLFKLTGYTMGAREIPLSVMAVVGYTKTADKTAGGVDRSAFSRDGAVVLQSASLFLAGKVTDNLGIFSQWTYTPFGGDDGLTSHSNVDNTEIRFADRFIEQAYDLIVGGFVNNNPSLQDVWNSTPAWGFPYVQSAFGTMPVAAPMVAGGFAQQAVGGGAYLYWNQMVYGELSLYGTANGAFSVLRAGDLGTRFSKPAPYWRLALTHDWGAHTAMLGTFGMVSELHNDPTDTSSSTNRFRDIGFDGQYQYILDPHTVTAHLTYIQEHQDWGADQVAAGTNSRDTLTQFRLKGSYTYLAKYGANLAYQRGSGSADPALYNSGDPLTGSASGSPAYSVWIPEVFWAPVQYLRVGLQYWHYSKYNGASTDYTGMGRNAKNNDMAFFYLWGVM
jgi:hypothetical protein